MFEKRPVWKAITLVIFVCMLIWMPRIPAKGAGTILYVGEGGYATIEEAIEAAADGDEIQISEGSHQLSQISLDKSLSISAVQDSIVTIVPAADTGTNRNWIYVEPNHSVQITGLIFDGSGRKIDRAIYGDGTLNIEECDFKYIEYRLGKGRAITLHGDQSIVRNCSFSHMGELGVYVYTATNCLLEDNYYRGKGMGEQVDYAFKIGGGADVVIRGNHIQYCRGSMGSIQSSGIYIVDNLGQPIVASVEGNNEIENNLWGIKIDLTDPLDYQISIHGNQIYQNSTAIATNYGIDATGNYWGGDAPAPLHSPNGVPDRVIYCPWALDTVDADQDGNYDHLVKPIALSWANGGNEPRNFDPQDIQGGDTFSLSVAANTIQRAPDQENVVFVLQWEREGGLQASDITVNASTLDGNQYHSIPCTITQTPTQQTFTLHFTRSGAYTLHITIRDG